MLSALPQFVFFTHSAYQLVTVKDIVAKYQARGLVANKPLTYQERLRKPIGAWLLSIT